eukprot:TRINITY_DN3951_c0_g1_i1.p1 TRINITY_DN3951_c0_g1~~TRINITY_DN3951_c0_g1_i1.p1  ORF type:complete len:360 (-),score=76.86 TRINITY_DN3951_c0_g1_i1:54-1133(-)
MKPIYTFSQTDDELTVVFEVPKEIKRRNLTVNFTKTEITAGITGQEPVIQGTLWERIDPSGSLWQLESSSVTIHIEKKNHQLWQALIKSSIEGSPDKIDPQSLFVLGQFADQFAPRNPTLALERYQAAAARGFSRAKQQLGLIQIRPEHFPGFKQDAESGLKNLTEAAQEGEVDAMLYLTELYESGVPGEKDGPIKKDSKKAMFWLARAVELRDQKAYAILKQTEASLNVEQREELLRTWKESKSFEAAIQVALMLSKIFQHSKNGANETEIKQWLDVASERAATSEENSRSEEVAKKILQVVQKSKKKQLAQPFSRLSLAGSGLDLFPWRNPLVPAILFTFVGIGIFALKNPLRRYLQ